MHGDSQPIVTTCRHRLVCSSQASEVHVALIIVAADGIDTHPRAVSELSPTGNKYVHVRSKQADRQGLNATVALFGLICDIPIQTSKVS